MGLGKGLGMPRHVWLIALALVGMVAGPASAAPWHTITVDGSITDWQLDEKQWDDPVGDVRWGGNNDSDDLYCTWDSTTLYLAFTDDAAGSNSAMIFIDADADSLTGWTDFTTDPTWKRHMTFSSVGIDLYFGEYGNHTGREVHRKDGATDTDITALCSTAYSGGKHEIGIPWNQVYPGGFPVGAQIRILAANPGSCDICGAYDACPNSTRDADSDGTPDESDPDTPYDQITDLDQSVLVVIDADADGIPDDLTSGDPGIDANGNPFEWEYGNVKTVDPRGDDGEPAYSTRDLIAFYFAEVSDRIVVRADLLSLNDAGGDENWLDVYVCIDYTTGGSTGLPNGISGTSPYEWDRCLVIDTGDVGDAQLFTDPTTQAPNDEIKAVSFSAAHDMVEGSLWKSDLGALSYPIRFFVFTVQDGNTNIADALSTDTGQFSGTAKVAYFHHGNQSMTGTSVLRGWDGPNSGFDEILYAHDEYGVRGNFHLSGTLQTVAEWFDPTFNEWLRDGGSSGQYDLVTSAYAQHIMPFVWDAMNDWAIATENELIEHIYNYTPRIGWVPERVWVTPGGIGNCTNDDITSDFNEQGVWAVILDDSPHGDNIPAGTQRHKIWQMNGAGAPKVFLRDGQFTSWMHNESDIHDDVVSYFVDFANAGDQEQIITYADDWEVAAEEGGFADMFPNAVEKYRETMEYIGGHPWIQSVKLTDALLWGWSIGNFTVTEGTYGLLGGTGGYGGSGNSWYCDWRGYVPWANGGAGAPAYNYGSTGNLKNYETLWMDAWTNLGTSHTGGSSPAADNLVEAGRYTVMSMLYETGWHDGAYISGWEHKHSCHVKNGNVYAAAADWAASPPAEAQAYLADVDDDGYTEAVIRNDKLMAVFDRIGGCARWIVDYEGQVVSGNDMAYWNNASLEHPAGSGYWHDDAGDFSDGHDAFSSGNQTAVVTDNHIAGVDREKTEYDITIDTASGIVARITISDGTVTKTVELTFGDQYLDIHYGAMPDTADNYMLCGFSPNVLDLIKNGRNNLDRLYQGTYPNPKWAGSINTATGTVGAVILGGPSGGGLVHSWDGTETICWSDEYRIHSYDHFFVYCGPGNAAILDSLSQVLQDLTDVEEDTAERAPSLKLRKTYPNPFNPSTSIEFALPGSMNANLSIYDLQGRLVMVLVDGFQTAGVHTARWDGMNAAGYPVSPGVYFCTLEAGGKRQTAKLILVK
ncbi:MAG: T9SS type A sorting domain-containing protein [Candidatus Eisenbacteria sp.]|nr:T9SS type A sorting domain-containing protein [Candidatus Eisenbacteria bacterium]